MDDCMMSHVQWRFIAVPWFYGDPDLLGTEVARTQQHCSFPQEAVVVACCRKTERLPQPASYLALPSLYLNFMCVPTRMEVWISHGIGQHWQHATNRVCVTHDQHKTVVSLPALNHLNYVSLCTMVLSAISATAAAFVLLLEHKRKSRAKALVQVYLLDITKNGLTSKAEEIKVQAYASFSLLIKAKNLWKEKIG